MLGVILASIGTFFEETSTSLGKWEISRKVESPFTFGFLQLFWGGVILLGIALIREGSFIFSLASLPTFLPRVILEIIQAHVTVLAVARASRSTFGCIRILTVPILLIVDVAFGLTPTMFATIGIVVIIATLIILLRNHGIERAGSGLVLFSAVNAVATLSLYQYDVRHFNSVVAEQLLMYAVLITYFGIAAIVVMRERPFHLLMCRVTLGQSLVQGVGGVIESFAVLFAPISIVLAAKRSSSVLWSVLAGRLTFHEDHFIVKVAAAVFLVIGLVLLAV